MSANRYLTVRLVTSLIMIFSTRASFVDFSYHNYNRLTQLMDTLHTLFPNVTHLYSIGTSVQGRELWAMAVSSPGNADKHRPLVPEVKLVGNIHGNEPVGKELLLQLIYYLAANYGTDRSVTRLLHRTRIHILPSMNPDGFERSQEGDCTGNRGRDNANNYDLNRNFPDYFEDNSATPLQPETKAVINWVKSIPFILSASFHGGALVASYPYDNYYASHRRQKIARPSLSPDEDTFKYLALTYANSHYKMKEGRPCPGDYYMFPKGITNGAAWYPLTGGMQDYNYIRHGCFEITLEVSCCKYPLAGNLTMFWMINKDPILNYIRMAHTGIRGFVKNMNDRPIPGASIDVIGRENTFTTTADGEYWKLLLPGTYKLQVSVPGCEPTVHDIAVTSNKTHTAKNLTYDCTELYSTRRTSTGSHISNMCFIIISLLIFVCL